MDNTEDSAVQDFLQILEEHRKNCERQGKYVEAEIAKNRLDELKLHEENRRRVCTSFARCALGRYAVSDRKRYARGKSRSGSAWRRHTCLNSNSLTCSGTRKWRNTSCMERN
jgi:hypothetical protein